MPAPRVDITGALRKMRAISTVLKRPMRDVLDTAARATSKEMARRAAPFGTGDAAKTSGEKAVVRDISRVYGNAGAAFEAISSGKAQGAFWYWYKFKNYEKAAEIAKGAGINIGGFDNGAAHRSARDKLGRVRQRRPTIYIIDPRERRKLEKYIKSETNKVGTAKGGFADIIRTTGGTIRGLRERGDITANWITRKGRGFGASFKGGSDENPTLRIRNRLNYADEALTPRHRVSAIREGYNRAIEALRYAVKKEARELKARGTF